MKVGRFIIRLIVSYLIGGVATWLLFVVVAWLTGQLPSGIHSNAAFVLLLLPVAWGTAFWWLARVGFPPSSDASSA
jgi:hypothetical protein